jgi:hypothetical protein
MVVPIKIEIHVYFSNRLRDYTTIIYKDGNA